MPVCAWIGGGQRTTKGVLFRILSSSFDTGFFIGLELTN